MIHDFDLKMSEEDIIEESEIEAEFRTDEPEGLLKKIGFSIFPFLKSLAADIPF